MMTPSPRRARIGARFCSIPFISLFLGCASSYQTPIQAIHAYADACENGDMETAKIYYAPHGENTPVCPDAKGIQALKKLDAEFDYTAQIGDSSLIRRDGGAYRLQMSPLLDTQSPLNLLYRLKAAIASQNSDHLYALFSNSLTERLSSDTLRESFRKNASAWNDIYAAISAQPHPEFHIQNKTASCDLAGYTLRFTAENSQWRIAQIEPLL